VVFRRTRRTRDLSATKDNELWLMTKMTIINVTMMTNAWNEKLVFKILVFFVPGCIAIEIAILGGTSNLSKAHETHDSLSSYYLQVV